MALPGTLRSPKAWLAGVGLVLLAAGGAAYALARLPSPAAGPGVTLAPEPAAADPEQVHQVCGSCHAYPPPDSFPRRAWRHELRQAYDFLRDSDRKAPLPSLESVLRY